MEENNEMKQLIMKSPNLAIFSAKRNSGKTHLMSWMIYKILVSLDGLYDWPTNGLTEQLNIEILIPNFGCKCPRPPHESWCVQSALT